MQNLETEVSIRRPLIVGIGGLTSEVGKTTLMCDLLKVFSGWEAIKTTRGHYRSCGKDPHACCVSHLLEDKPVVRSGRDLTHTRGKDSGRYWDAGAVNVHWVIATDTQVEDGVKEAVGRVRASGVFVEGNSFTQSMTPDFFIMVVRPDRRSIKTSARQALSLVSAVYVSGQTADENEIEVKEFLGTFGNLDSKTPVFFQRDFTALVESILTRVARQTTMHKAAS